MPRKNKEVEVTEAPTVGADKYLESFAQNHRIALLDKGTIEMFKRAGFKLRTKPITAPQFGPTPIGYQVEVQIGKFLEKA